MKIDCLVGQGFGANWTPWYKEHGLRGHTGIDTACGYGSVIFSYWDMLIYKTIRTPNISPDGFTGIFGIVDDGVELYEAHIGHVKDVVVDDLTFVKKGQVIGHEGNNGTVWSGSGSTAVLITKEMKANGDTRGAHRHVQKRPVKQVKRTSPNKTYLTTIGGGHYRDNDGNYYEVWDYSNGYNGCENPLTSPFNEYMYPGAVGYDVFCLQRFLAREGHNYFQETGFTGYFGTKTAQAVIEYQRKVGIQPVFGGVGPKTLSSIKTKLQI